MKNIKTTIHYYSFDTSNTDQKREYYALRDKLDTMGLKCFASIDTDHYSFYRDQIKPLDGQEIELEVKHLFDNQWNTAPTVTSDKGLRVFDWAEAIFTNRKIKTGMWLEQTQEMFDIRHNMTKCGFCGHIEPLGPAFCPKCIGNQYLEEKEIFLTRMKTIDYTGGREPLTEEEQAQLIPAWREAQGLGKIAREKENASYRRKIVAAFLPDAEKKAQELIEEAKIKTIAFTWLLDHMFSDIENVIYYSHTKTFSFGWRNHYTQERRDEVVSLLNTGFPYPWEFHK